MSADAAPRGNRLFLKKSIANIQKEAARSELKRSLGPINLVSLGVGQVAEVVAGRAAPLIDMGRHDEAQTATKRAIQLNPALSRAHANLSLERLTPSEQQPADTPRARSPLTGGMWTGSPGRRPVSTSSWPPPNSPPIRGTPLRSSLFPLSCRTPPPPNAGRPAPCST